MLRFNDATPQLPARMQQAKLLLPLVAAYVGFLGIGVVIAEQPAPMLTWEQLPELPDSLGVAGPFVGVHNDALVIAGGANFPRPVWANDKQWLDRIHVLVKTNQGYVWNEAGRLRRPAAYGAAVSTADGIICMGGNDADETFDEVFLMSYDPKTNQIAVTEYPPLPAPCAFGSAALVDNVVYLAGGQSGASLATAMDNFWTLNLAHKNDPTMFRWKQLDPLPGPSRALNLTIAQDQGKRPSLYVISGRRQADQEVQFLKDVWQFTPETGKWRRRADAPRSVMAGVGIAHGPTHILVLGGADGSLFHQADQLRDGHPGFPKQAWAYHSDTDTWSSAGTIPQNHVTTSAVGWDGAIIVPSGEIRPRVRSPKVWKVSTP